LLLSEMEKQIITYIDGVKDEIISFVCELIRTPSVNPPGNEMNIVKLIQDKCRRLELGSGQIIAKTPERPNIVFAYKKAEGEKRIFLNGHLDTKPVGNRDEWETDPFEPRIIDGRLYGLGASDMKGAIGALIYSLAAIKRVGLSKGGCIELILTADEEGGSSYGAYHLCKEYQINTNIGLIAEPAGITSPWENIYLAARRALGFKTRIFGTELHSSLKSKIAHIDANEKMMNVIAKMKKEMKLKAPVHNYYPEGIVKNIAVQMSGGVYYGLNPGYAEFRSELRLPPGIYFKDVSCQVEAFIDKLKEEDPELEIEVIWEIPAPGSEDKPVAEVSEDEAFIADLKEAANDVLGFMPPFGGFPGGTDAAIFQRKTGIPTIPAFGPGLLSVCHRPNEFVFIEDIIRAAKIYALSAVKYLNK
jgi:acetylornithine deacetylase/succinyl-diaminopimelate desuccinylase-like protein